jgi:lipoprotein-releasing system permease protein
MQKSKEIGILRAMGASQGQILRVFLIQGGALGLAGSFFGSALGALAIVLWGALVKNPDGTPLFPLDLDPLLFVGAAVLATLTGVVAALAPAVRGARLDPVVAIRG